MPYKDPVKEREYKKEYYRKYRENNREKFREYNRIYNKKWRDKFGYKNEYEYVKRNPKKRKAQQLLQYAVKTKRIKKEPCKICGKIKLVQGHHKDYSKPLEVVWLCPLHHKHVHMKKISC